MQVGRRACLLHRSLRSRPHPALRATFPRFTGEGGNGAIAAYVEDPRIFVTRANCSLSCAKRGGGLGRGLFLQAVRRKLNPSSKNPEF